MVDLKQMIVSDRPDLLFKPYTPRFPERIRDYDAIVSPPSAPRIS
ncbi:hypothetical protein [Asaia platycodi]